MQTHIHTHERNEGKSPHNHHQHHHHNHKSFHLLGLPKNYNQTQETQTKKKEYFIESLLDGTANGRENSGGIVFECLYVQETGKFFVLDFCFVSQKDVLDGLEKVLMTLKF